MALKPTRRKNGRNLVTVSVKHYVEHETVVSLVATEFEDHFDADSMPTKGEIEKELRSALWNHGSDFEITVGDNLDELDDRDGAFEWAKEVVDHYWPTWSQR